MIFYYNYINHTLEEVQSLIEHLVKEVWCNATGTYSHALLRADLRQIVIECEDNVNNGDGKFSTFIQEIYRLFIPLSPKQKEYIRNAFDTNNSIEELCTNPNFGPPVLYSDIHRISASLATALQKFFRYLWDNGIDLCAMRDAFGSLENHFEIFCDENDENVCPFCGINPLERCQIEDYDHYLPKGTYPFISVNFRNLVPMCQRCNSRYKHVESPIVDDDNNRRKSFYPFSQLHPGISIQIGLNTRDINSVNSENINLEIECENHDEEIQTWKSLFGIEMRYKDRCSSKNGGRAWYTAIIDEYENAHFIRRLLTNKNELLRMKKREAQRLPFSDMNFLKRPFLEACEANGMFR